MVSAGRTRVSAIVLVAVILAIGQVATAAGAAAWHVSHTPPASGFLDGITADSRTDAWAIGATNGSPFLNILHNGGSGWHDVDPPGVHGDSVLDNAIAAVSPSDVWIAGEDVTTATALLEHWNGTRWSLPPVPGGTRVSAFTVLARVPGTRMLWAFGAARRTQLIDFFDGRTWSQVPAAPGSVGFNGAAACSASDAWAVGYMHNAAYLEHWNGKVWRVAHDAGSRDEILFGVTCVPGTHDVWIVGSAGNGPFAELRHAGTWTQTPLPALSRPGVLYGVASSGPGTAWAVGFKGAGGRATGLIAHWDGRRWTYDKPPAGRYPLDPLSAICGVPGSAAVWAAGSSQTADLSAQTEYIIHHA